MNNKEFDFYPFETESKVFDEKYIFIDQQTIQELTGKAFTRLSFTFTKKHLEHLINATLARDASDNDRYVCASLLKNAQIASEGILPLCQDTGIANIFAWKDSHILTNGKDEESISQAIKKVYAEKKLRNSTVCSRTIFDEYDPANNLPPQTMIFSGEEKFKSEPAYHFLFCAKGGGSSNKTVFIQGTKAYLNETKLKELLSEKIAQLGTSACPPYTISLVIGGLSPEQNLLTLKLASAGFYDSDNSIPTQGYRDTLWEKTVLEIATNSGLGAQFGGTKMALDAQVIRLPRHGASCPISLGVSCSAHRNIEGYITSKGFYLEKTVAKPADLPHFDKALSFASLTNSNEIIHTDKGIDFLRKTLQQKKIGEKLLLSGKILVARDAAHARWYAMVQDGKELPEYTKMYPICYAGPSQTPKGKVIGSFGPTTAGRMDTYADFLMEKGASYITIAKGNRSKEFREACKKHTGFYLGTLGGAAALIAESYIKSVDVIDFPELGMEAVRLIHVENLPVFLLTNHLGEDFYA